MPSLNCSFRVRKIAAEAEVYAASRSRTARSAALRADAAELSRLARVYREAKTKVAYPLSSGVPKARTACFFWVGESPVRVLNFGTRRYL